MAGSFDLNSGNSSLGGFATPIGVYYYDPDQEDQPFALLPNLVPVRIDFREGPEPPVASFRYLLDDSLALNLGWPSRFDQLWPIDAQGPYVAQQDDRLVVAGLNPDGSTFFLFDGFAQVPQVDLDPSGERVSFTAVSVAARAWDDVIHTRVQRDADTPDDTSGNSDFEIHAECRFNPADQSPDALGGILPNSTNNPFYTVSPDEPNNKYPVFLDPLLLEREAQEGLAGLTGWLSLWFVSDALLYLLVQPNPADDFVTWPDSKTITDLLMTLAPPQGSTIFNPNTAVTADCVIRDYNATGKTLPEAMADLLIYAGFLLTWEIGTDANGLPETSLRFYRRDGAATGSPKPVYLDVPGNSLANGSINNVTEIHLARDVNHIVNAWRTETRPKQIEVTVVLAPLFQPTAADSQSTNRLQFQEANLTNATATVRRKYRWYGADECGDFYWNMANDEEGKELIDFSPIFPNNSIGIKTYVVRYRPGTDTVIAQDSNGRPLRATLEVYSQPGIYSGDPYIQTQQSIDNSKWLTIKRGWRLLDDRLGIEITASDPEEWATGNPKMPKIAAITQCANPSSTMLPFILRLTTTVYADVRIKAEAKKRPSSPTVFTRWRSVDAHDHFQYCAVSPGSINFPNVPGTADPDTGFKIVRDDTDSATAHAEQLRSAFEMPPTAGTLRLPGIITTYSVGDRIDQIYGRNVSLQTNVGGNQSEASVYPWIVGVSWSMDGEQYTTLQLSDRRSDIAHHMNSF